MRLFCLALALLLAGWTWDEDRAKAEPLLPMYTTSINWSGYAVERRKPEPKLRSVSASWTVPKLDCSNVFSTVPLAATYSAQWVGLDGFASNTVEQIGTSADCLAFDESYSVWYEMYPDWPQDIGIDVSPGDRITASVVWAGGSRFRLSLRDETTNESFKIARSLRDAARHSAEAIVEAPWSPLFGVLPLSPFGVASFDHVVFDGRDPSSLMTLNRIEMTDQTDRRVMRTSVSDMLDSSFNITWLRA